MTDSSGSLAPGRDLRAWARLLRAHFHRSSGQQKRARAVLDGSRAAILMYHRVLPRSEADRLAVESGMYVTPESFALQLDVLQRHFSVLPLAEVVERRESGKTLPPGACAITFDDGWLDNVEHAAPALRARSLPATIFAVADRVGTSGAFWPDEVARRMRPLGERETRELLLTLGLLGNGSDPLTRVLDHLKGLDREAREIRLEALRAATPAPAEAGRELAGWDELCALAGDGIDVESHGASHELFPHLEESALRAELRRVRGELRQRGLGAQDLLAYPSGAHDARVRRIAAEEGFRAAVTVERGLLGPGCDPYQIPRLGVHEDIGATEVEFLDKVPG